jgi:two-component system chemotaxis response regulator CheY
MGKTVLIVDDSMYIRVTIKDALTAAGYEVVGEAATGEAAIDLALSLEPDLITLDNILPDMIGVDILRVLKQDEELESKIVMVSAVGQASVVNEAIELGAAAYIIKPFAASDLAATLNHLYS